MQWLFSPAPVAWHVLFWLKFTSYAIIPALAFGAITRSLGTSFLAALGTYIGFIALGLVIYRLTPKNAAQGLFNLTSHQLSTVFILVGLTALATVAHQYLSRRTFRSIALLSVGIAISIVSVRWITPAVPRHSFTPGEDARTLASSIALAPKRIDVTAQPISGSPVPHTQISVHLTATGLPPDHYLLPLRARHHWEGLHGIEIESEPVSRIADAELILHREINRPLPTGFTDTLPSLLARQLFTLTTKPAYTGDYTFQLLRTDIVLETPLQPGARPENSGHRLYLNKIDTATGTIEFLTFDPAGSEDGPDPELAASVIGPLERFTYAVYDRRTGRPWKNRSFGRIFNANMGITRRELSLTADTFVPSGSDLRKLASNLPADWADHAILVKLRHTPVGNFTHTLHAPEVRYTVLNPKPSARTGPNPEPTSPE